MDLKDPRERTAHAGEYVLGTLSADERREFESAASGDAALRDEQYFWERRFAGLAHKVARVEPRPIVWLQLAQRITPRVTRMPARTAPLTAAWTAFATAASVILAIGLYRESSRPPQIERVEVPVVAQAYVAVLQMPKSSLRWTVSAVPSRRQLTVRAEGDVPDDLRAHDTELWLITDAGPVSLGVIGKSGETRTEWSYKNGLPAGRTLAVSLEPPGGSPTGKPTGPVITTATVLQVS